MMIHGAERWFVIVVHGLWFVIVIQCGSRWSVIVLVSTQTSDFCLLGDKCTRNLGQLHWLYPHGVTPVSHELSTHHGWSWIPFRIWMPISYTGPATHQPQEFAVPLRQCCRVPIKWPHNFREQIVNISCVGYHAAAASYNHRFAA